MKVVIEYRGKIYESKETAEISQEEAFRAIYDDFERMHKLNVELADGSKIILGKEALQRAVIKVMP